MDVDCEGCAGCCIDWRPLSPAGDDHERRGPRTPLDDVYNLVSLTRDEVVALVERGVGDAMQPRMWAASEGDERAGASVEIDGVDVAALGGRPAFFVGLRKPPKPVAPFGHPRTWLRACAFLDPNTLQCRIHGDEEYPDECAEYPGHNLVLGQETECERVESAFGGERLVDDAPPEGLRGLLLGPQALGSKVFAHPDPSRLGGVVERMRRGDLTAADRAEFVGIAAGSRPGSLEVAEDRAEGVRATVAETASWVSEAVEGWTAAAGEPGTKATDAPGDVAEGTSASSQTQSDDVDERTPVGRRASESDFEVERGAPETPGWDAVGADEGRTRGEKR